MSRGGGGGASLLSSSTYTLHAMKQRVVLNQLYRAISVAVDKTMCK